MVRDRQIFLDSKPDRRSPGPEFPHGRVKPDREQYEPREEGALTVTTRDHQGRPVSAEVALGLTDESVYYIQQDYAADPRQFYYGVKRPLLVQTQSTFQQKSYAKLVEGADKRLIDGRERVSMLRARTRQLRVPMRNTGEQRKLLRQIRQYRWASSDPRMTRGNAMQWR